MENWITESMAWCYLKYWGEGVIPIEKLPAATTGFKSKTIL